MTESRRNMSDNEIEVAKEPLENIENSADGYGFFCKVTDEHHFKRIEDKVRKRGYFTDRVLFIRAI